MPSDGSKSSVEESNMKAHHEALTAVARRCSVVAFAVCGRPPSPVEGQSEVGSWLAFTGCWTPLEQDAAERPTLCVVPGEDRFSAEFRDRARRRGRITRGGARRWPARGRLPGGVRRHHHLGASRRTATGCTTAPSTSCSTARVTRKGSGHDGHAEPHRVDGRQRGGGRGAR